jgi:hypothetical protein
MRVGASPEGHRESTRGYVIATRAREGASIAGGMPQEHEAILDCKQACENASISRKTPQKHKAILNCMARGESKGLKCAPLKV